MILSLSAGVPILSKKSTGFF